jgi:hypothetical protein
MYVYLVRCKDGITHRNSVGDSQITDIKEAMLWWADLEKMNKNCNPHSVMEYKCELSFERVIVE